MTHVETPDDAIDYIYNFEGLRVAKHVDSNKDGTIDRSEYFSYGPIGNDILLDFVDSDGEATTESAELSHRYAWNPAAVDQLLAQEDIDVATQDTNSDGILEEIGEVKYPLADHLHSNRDWAEYDDVTDTTSITTHVVIDTYGNINETASTGEGSAVSRYLYTSQEYEGETDLHYYDARWYDPRVGKFISEDPIGFKAGDANLTRYVFNLSNIAIDPQGLEKLPAGPDMKRYGKHLDAWKAPDGKPYSYYMSRHHIYRQEWYDNNTPVGQFLDRLGFARDNYKNLIALPNHKAVYKGYDYGRSPHLGYHLSAQELYDYIDTITSVRLF